MIRSGKVRRAKLYYLRDRTGKSARISEKIKKKIGIDVEVKPEQVTEENVAQAIKEKSAETSIDENKVQEAQKVETKKEEPKKESIKKKK